MENTYNKNGEIYQNNNSQITESKQMREIITTNDIINFISSKLNSIIQNNKIMRMKQSRGPNEPFFSRNIPALNIYEYLIRIIKYTECENNTLIISYLYILKLINKENFILGINNIYRLLLGAVVLAKKVLEDIRFNNSYYCLIGGITNIELNQIEYSLFVRIDFNVNMGKKDLDKIYEEIYSNLPQSRLNEIQKEVTEKTK